MFMSCVFWLYFIDFNKLLPKKKQFRIKKFLWFKNCSFLDKNNLLLFRRNPFHTSHPEEYRWFRGGPREILGILRNSSGSQRLEGVSRVVGVPGVQ